MGMAEPTVAVAPSVRWMQRARLVVAALVVWFATDQLAVPLWWGHPLDAPLTLFVGHGLMPTLGVLAVLLVAATLASSMLAGDACRTLVAVGAGVTLWAFSGGTMDAWLIAQHPVPGPPDGGPYRALVAEYVGLAVLVCAVMFIAAAIRTRRLDPGLLQEAVREPGGRWQTRGPQTLAIVSVVAALLVPVLVGPRVGWTRHGQVGFAVVVAFFVATLVGRRFGGARGLLWYAVSPFVVGLVGLIWAMLRPSLGGAYARLDNVPANGLVRPLPAEMVFLGLATIGWTLYSKRLRGES